MSKKKAVILVIIAFILGIAVGAGVMLGVNAGDSTGTLKPKVYYNGKCGDNVTWEISTDGVLTISGTGPMYDYEPAEMANDKTDYGFDADTMAPWTNHEIWFTGGRPVKEIVIEDGVTSIGACAFCFKYFANSEGWSEADNKDIEGMSNDDGNRAFKIVSLTIPDSVTTIGADAFTYSDLSELDVEIPAGVTSMNFNSFYCQVKSFSVDPANTVYAMDNGVILTNDRTEVFKCATGFTGKYEVPDTVTKIGEYAFDSCTGLTEIVLPDGLQEICDGAFTGCTGLKSVKLPDGLQKIDDEAFNGAGLEAAYIPDSVTYIGASAFSAMDNLEYFSFSVNVTYVGDNAFLYDFALKSFEFRGGSEEILLDDLRVDLDPWGYNGSNVQAAVTYPPMN